MWTLISKNKLVLNLYFFILAIACAFAFIEGKTDSQLLIDKLHTPYLDVFFRIITFLGDGMFMVLAGIIFLFLFRIRFGLMFLSSFIFSSLTVQLLKRFAFPEFDRPVLYFEKIGIQIYKIPALEYHSHFSFPSGHSTTAFALFIGLSFLTTNRLHQIVLLLIACLTAFSRAYLSQHFMEDIIAGSILGVLTAILMYYIYSAHKGSWMDKRLFKQNSLKNA